MLADTFGLELSNAHPAADADCPSWTFTEFVAGGSEPDWGPADVNPQPRSTPAPQPTPSPSPSTRTGARLPSPR